jgi:hypothetical protein
MVLAKFKDVSGQIVNLPLGVGVPVFVIGVVKRWRYGRCIIDKIREGTFEAGIGVVDVRVEMP